MDREGAPVTPVNGDPLPHGEPPSVTIDVQQLADRVYRLFQAEARLARARADPALQRRGG